MCAREVVIRVARKGQHQPRANWYIYGLRRKRSGKGWVQVKYEQPLTKRRLTEIPSVARSGRFMAIRTRLARLPRPHTAIQPFSHSVQQARDSALSAGECDFATPCQRSADAESPWAHLVQPLASKVSGTRSDRDTCSIITSHHLAFLSFSLHFSTTPRRGTRPSTLLKSFQFPTAYRS